MILTLEEAREILFDVSLTDEELESLVEFIEKVSNNVISELLREDSVDE